MSDFFRQASFDLIQEFLRSWKTAKAAPFSLRVPDHGYRCVVVPVKTFRGQNTHSEQNACQMIAFSREKNPAGTRILSSSIRFQPNGDVRGRVHGHRNQHDLFVQAFAQEILQPGEDKHQNRVGYGARGVEGNEHRDPVSNDVPLEIHGPAVLVFEIQIRQGDLDRFPFHTLGPGKDQRLILRGRKNRSFS